jgi:hypothetical protein
VSDRALQTIAILALAALLIGCGGQASTGNVGQLLNDGWRAYAIGNFDPAAASFQRVVQDGKATDEQRYSALLGLAVSVQYQPTPDLDAALQYYEQLAQLKVTPAVPQSMLGIGMVYVAQGRVEEGRAELSRLTQQFPDSEEAGEATMQLANSLFRPAPDDKAVGGYRLADPAFVQRGMALLERRLAAYPSSPLAAAMHMMLASELIEQQSFKEAVTHLEAALKAGVESSTTRGSITWQIARIADEKLHDYALAEKYYGDYAEKYKRTQLYYLAQLSRDRMEKLLAAQTKE